MTIRRATINDAALLARLHRDVHAAHVQAEPDAYRVAPEEQVLGLHRERLTSPDVVAFLGEAEGGEAVGYVVCQRVRREASTLTSAREYLLVVELGVAPGRRRAGLGRALMGAAEALARELGVSRVELDVRAWNVGARAFYEALGYAPAQLRLGRALSGSGPAAVGRSARTLEVREATREDTASIAALHMASRRAAYRGLMPDRLLDGEAAARRRLEAWERRLARPGEASVWVAIEDGAPLGFVSTAPARDPDLDPARSAEVTSLYADPARLGQGVGRALLYRALADLRARGFEDVVLWVLEGNARAERFYSRAGFAPGAHEVKQEDGADLPHVRWRRAL
ncbi:MAG: GNAT family N-acetyltransferase [Planctomycetes bacterium]|nr:GNAT family N-acetyltransferase [Planctomycetota bacterium]